MTAGGSHTGISKRKSLSKGSPAKKSGRKVPDSIQLRPSNWEPDDSGCRAADNKLSFTEEQPHGYLDAGVVWDDLRPDLKCTIQTGVNYDSALEWMNVDRVSHHLFPEDLPVEMLASMMFWNRLDDTPLARRVPDRFFLEAEVRLDEYRTLGLSPAFWKPLPSAEDEEVQAELMRLHEDSNEYEDDETKDATYDPREDQGEEDADMAMESESKTEEDSPSKRKKRRNSGSDFSDYNSKRNPPTKRSYLAKKKFKNLTLYEMTLIETHDAWTVSWRHYGILMTRGVRSANVDFQTYGFPDYAINQKEVKFLKPRWREEEYLKLIRSKPWVAMFAKRSRYLFFHYRTRMTIEARNAIHRYIEFVQENLQAFWEALHWITIDTSIPSSAVIHRARSGKHESIKEKLITLKKDMLEAGVPDSIFDEPGVWKYPARLCYWVLMHPEHTNAKTGEPYAWSEQLVLLEKKEPARSQ